MVEEKAFAFAVRIVKLCRYLQNNKHEYVLSKQLVPASGQILRKHSRGQSKADLTAKMSIALKEAAETKYWLRLLYAADYLTKEEYQSIYDDSVELERMLTSIVKSSKH